MNGLSFQIHKRTDFDTYFQIVLHYPKAFEQNTVISELHEGVQAVASAALLDSSKINGSMRRNPVMPSVDPESGTVPLGRVYGQMLMALANSCVLAKEANKVNEIRKKD